MASLLVSITASAFLPCSSAHGWVTSPVSKNELAFHHYQDGMPSDFRYEPQSSNIGNGGGGMETGAGYSCGAKSEEYTEGLATWQKWYDEAGVGVPKVVPGQDLHVDVTLTVDHGGQAWMELACADRITDDGPWVLLERAQSDRSHHFMPSTPGIYAWAPLEAKTNMGMKLSATWTVPASFTCPSGKGVARWLWKTGNSCQDSGNVGRPTETFNLDELSNVYDEFQHRWMERCSTPPETFISCMDFVTASGAPLV